MWLFYVLIDYYWALHEYKIKFGRGINLTGYDFLTSASCGSQNTGVALIGNMSETVFNLSFIKCFVLRYTNMQKNNCKLYNKSSIALFRFQVIYNLAKFEILFIGYLNPNPSGNFVSEKSALYDTVILKLLIYCSVKKRSH